MRKRKGIAILNVVAMLLVMVLPMLAVFVQPVQAANLTQAYLRADRMKARRIPELSFRLDETMENADRILRIMNQLSNGEKTGTGE